MPDRRCAAFDGRSLADVVCLLLVTVLSLATTAAGVQRPQVVDIRGRQQTLFVYGSARGDPIVLSSGDGGWLHLAPHVAEFLASQGFYVIGLDTRAYLAGFTSGTSALRVEDEPGDYHVLARLARRATGKPPILIGVSEGAGLSVLAATDPATKADILGVVGLGLPDLNELGWRWKDVLIYLTHRAPNEPSFSAAAIVGRVSPLPLAAIHSTHDEFVPAAEVTRVLQGANAPKRLWLVEASNHRFSDNLAAFDRQLLEAIAWVKANSRGR